MPYVLSLELHSLANNQLTLEHLEDTFYRTVLSNYSQSAFAAEGYPPWVRNRLQQISNDEFSHVQFLVAGLKAAGAKPVEACTYAFPVTSPSTALAVASILEGVGVSAYLGAAPSVTSKDYLEYAGQIVTVEARHNTWIRSAVEKGEGFAEDFDTPLDFDQVYSLASPFFVKCPSSNEALPVKAFTPLAITSTNPQPGQDLTFSSKADLSNAYAAFVGPMKITYVKINNNKATIPDGFYGQSYVVATSSKDSLTDANTLAGPAIFDVYRSSDAITPVY